MLKSNRGITMIQMVVTIIMMVLIAGFSIYNSNSTIIETKIAKVYKEMVEVKNSISNINLLEEDLSNILGAGALLENLNSYRQLSSYYEAGTSYYYLDFDLQGNSLEDSLEIRNIENNYIISIKDATDIGIFIVNGIKIDGETYYSYDEILEKYNDIFAGR